MKKVFYRLKNQRFDFLREKWYADQFGRMIAERHNSNTDLFFSLSTQPIAYLKSNKPIVFYTDATFAQMIGFYFNNLSNESIKHGMLVEKQALENTNMAIYASQWAANSAIKDYGIDPNKVKVVPRGANIVCNRDLEDIKEIVAEKLKGNAIKLLFVGVEWIRKGGDKAYEVVKFLNDNNIQAELHIVGMDTIPIEPLPSYVINHGFLNKSIASHNETLERLYLESHFFLLPTVADTFGIVFAESNSFGLPALSYDIGGISSVILNNINGYCFNPDVSIEEIACYIKNVFIDESKYKDLCFSSFNEYKTRLNWSVSGLKIQQLLLSF
jgi:glycosyltransferase involved in cell wall biosynthesis